MTAASADRRRPASRRRRQCYRFLPKGRPLPDEVWLQRHRGLVALLWLHLPLLVLFALYRGHDVRHALLACSPLAVAGVVALVPRLGRAIRSCSVALGLVGAASVLVQLSDGATEAHFHFFVVIAFLSLYQAWLPFLVAIGYVLCEHGIVGVLDPPAVFNHPGMPGMNQDPWKWAFIHAGFVLAASVANLLAWRLTEREAMNDSLTGLPNRALFLDSVRAACERRTSRLVAVLFIDLDNFKDANDGFGHDSGDELLRAITHRLCAAARFDDLIGRLGGDEFSVVLQEVEDDADALQAAERFLAVFDEPFTLSGVSLRTSASMGLALNDDDPSMGAAALMRNADLAMYDAKRAGGAQVSRYRPQMYDVVLHRANFESELRGALEAGEFVVFYQPLVNVKSGLIVGNEALARWQHPTRGLVGPTDFIATVEQSGLITPLGRWVLRTACEQTVAWHNEHPDQRPLTVSVNVSPRQLSDHRIIEDVIEALRDSGLAPEYLCLEITEGALIKNFDAALPKLHALKTMGVSLALDDFGTGYSSLNYLRRLPVDSLKIDRSFIEDLMAGPGEHIVAAIISLAHTLGMSVTAEGVETHEQLIRLRAMSTDLAQGFLVGRPMPHAGVSELLDVQHPAVTHHTQHNPL